MYSHPRLPGKASSQARTLAVVDFSVVPASPVNQSIHLLTLSHPGLGNEVLGHPAMSPGGGSKKGIACPEPLDSPGPWTKIHDPCPADPSSVLGAARCCKPLDQHHLTGELGQPGRAGCTLQEQPPLYLDPPPSCWRPTSRTRVLTSSTSNSTRHDGTGHLSPLVPDAGLAGLCPLHASDAPGWSLLLCPIRWMD